MLKRQLMLVVHHDENIEEGLSYTLELARIMKKAISILMIYRRKAMKNFEDYMVATTFAEEGDFKTAKEMIIHDLKVKGIDYEERLKLIKEKCKSQGVELTGISSSKGDLISGIKNLVEDNSSIDMVLLSPSVTNSAKDLLYRLMKSLSMPIVTMVKNIKGKSA
jgi:hypothetical protein